MRFMMLMYPGPEAETEKSPVPDGPEAEPRLPPADRRLPSIPMPPIRPLGQTRVYSFSWPWLLLGIWTLGGTGTAPAGRARLWHRRYPIQRPQRAWAPQRGTV